MQTLDSLNPAFWPDKAGTGGYLSFDCPACGPKDRITNLHVSLTDIKPPYRWKMTGNPGNWVSISIEPSINYNNDHWHGYITKGMITP